MSIPKWITSMVLCGFFITMFIPTTIHASVSNLFKPYQVNVPVEGIRKSKTVIPGLDDQGWVPQGLSYIPAKKLLLISAYYEQGDQDRASTIIVVPRSPSHRKVVSLYENEKQKHSGHVGGVTVSDNYVWVASTNDHNSFILKYAIDDLIKAEDKGKIVPKQVHRMNHATSYVTYRQKFKIRQEPTKQLCIGSWIPNKNGTLYCHELDKQENLSLTNVDTYSTPPDVQGIEFYGYDIDRNIYVLYSRAFGRKGDSSLDVYRGLGNMSGRNPQSIPMPPMSQGIVQVGNQLYVNFESGAKKYRSGGKMQVYNLYYGDIRRLVKCQPLLTSC